jgi:hypothetical protein
MLKGLLLAESLRAGAELRVPALSLVAVVRRDVSASVAATQPPIWTFVEFEAPDDAAQELAAALARSLLAEGGWYADFTVGDDHVVVFADRIFRYRRGDQVARAEAVAYGKLMGVPEPQLDWGD